MHPLFRAQVAVCKTGYAWLRVEKKYGDAVLIPEPEFRRVREIGPEHFRHYDPLKSEPALFRIFAETEPTEAGILAFVNRYGDPSSANRGWPFEKWTFEIAQLRAAVDLADAVAAKDRKGLARHVRWKGQTLEWNSFLCQELAPPDQVLEPPPRFPPGNLLQPATCLLDWVIARYTAFSLYFLPSRLPGGSLVLNLEATSLLDVFWLQFALSVSGEKEFRRCEMCGKPFELSPELNRSDRTFCSDACRMRSFRRRQRKAVELRRAGMPLRQITKEVGSDLTTVKKWLEHTRAKK